MSLSKVTLDVLARGQRRRACVGMQQELSRDENGSDRRPVSSLESIDADETTDEINVDSVLLYVDGSQAVLSRNNAPCAQADVR